MKRRTPLERVVHDLDVALSQLQNQLEPYSSLRVRPGSHHIAEEVAVLTFWYKTHMHNIVLLARSKQPELRKGSYKKINDEALREATSCSAAQSLNAMFRAQLSLVRTLKELPLNASLVLQLKADSRPLTLITGLRKIHRMVEKTTLRIKRLNK